ncbi:MAG: hypothetical protein COV46_06715 [Deltaproteobacteria bacterium CG11_big_fil_rev_8_21_14_0_20_49_13]|nr:MAG: hypothetical protein COV46_06715 [Deltaproteobacteria bacterium CG11_big_fil_rev_8_21_14_0_20_49_13]
MPVGFRDREARRLSLELFGGARVPDEAAAGLLGKLDVSAEASARAVLDAFGVTSAAALAGDRSGSWVAGELAGGAKAGPLGDGRAYVARMVDLARLPSGSKLNPASPEFDRGLAAAVLGIDGLRELTRAIDTAIVAGAVRFAGAGDPDSLSDPSREGGVSVASGGDELQDFARALEGDFRAWQGEAITSGVSVADRVHRGAYDAAQDDFLKGLKLLLAPQVGDSGGVSTVGSILLAGLKKLHELVDNFVRDGQLIPAVVTATFVADGVGIYAASSSREPTGIRKGLLAGSGWVSDVLSAAVSSIGRTVIQNPTPARAGCFFELMSAILKPLVGYRLATGKAPEAEEIDAYRVAFAPLTTATYGKLRDLGLLSGNGNGSADATATFGAAVGLLENLAKLSDGIVNGEMRSEALRVLILLLARIKIMANYTRSGYHDGILTENRSPESKLLRTMLGLIDGVRAGRANAVEALLDTFLTGDNRSIYRLPPGGTDSERLIATAILFAAEAAAYIMRNRSDGWHQHDTQTMLNRVRALQGALRAQAAGQSSPEAAAAVAKEVNAVIVALENLGQY